MKKILLSLASSTIAVASFAQCTDLYFSEYIEGSGYNKALEIYNPTSAAIDLSTYSVELYKNGASTVSAGNTLNLTGTLNAGDVYIIGIDDAGLDAGIVSLSDTLHDVGGFNGNDALTLLNGTTQIDGIGEIGSSINWTVGSGSTKNNTLVRMATVNTGNIVWTGSGDTEWDVHPQDDFSFLGSHTADACGSAPTPLVGSLTLSEDTICIGAAINFTATITGGTAPYSTDVDFGDGSSLGTLTGSHTYTAAGTYSLVYTASDDAIPSLTYDSTITVVVNTCSAIKEEKVNSVSIYPNPSKDGLINLSNVEANSAVTVYNVIGEVVYNALHNGNKQLNLASLNKGTYFIAIANENNSITKKLIIE